MKPISLLVFLGAALFAIGASAEPYLAIETGLKCATCHVNPSGGGKRTFVGTLYARGQISSRTISKDPQSTPWNGDLNKWFAVGGNLRASYEDVDIDHVGSTSDFDITRATLYAEIRPIPNLLTVYVDQKVAPDDSINREAYLMLTPQRGKYTVKIGQMFLPFGLRLEDDYTFVRQTSGINFATPDDGIELGVELAKWSAQIAVSDGAAGGGGSNGSNNRVSLTAAYIMQRWRVGFSHNVNDDPLGDREMQGVFAGFKTGPISWLAELDFIKDESPTGTRDLYASLIEGNWRLRKGHNLKVAYEYLEPDGDRAEDEQERYSVVWEYNPIQFVQTRVGARFYNGIPNFPISNRNELFAQLHIYF